VRYRELLTQRLEYRRQKRLEAILAVVDGNWRTSNELAQMAGIPHHSAVRFLNQLVQQGDITAKPETWIDDRRRVRNRLLYREPEDNSQILNTVFGMPRIPLVSKNAAVKVHICRDD